MSLDRATTLLRRLRGTRRSAAFERDMAEELRLHIEFEAEALVRRGLAPAVALAEARRRFGSVALTEDACRDSRGVRFIDALAQDLRGALRTIVAHPGYSAIVSLLLALGIGANTAIFSVVHAVLLRSLPYASGDRLVEIHQQFEKRGGDAGLSVAELADYRADVASLDGIVEYHQMSFTLLDKSYPARVVTGVVSWQFFDLLGVRPLLGRTFRDDDDRPDAPAVVVLGYAFWQRTFGGDPHIVGRTFEMNDRVHTVIGILPPVPLYPADNDVYMPVSACPFRSAPAMAADRRMRMVSAIGRLKEGVTIERARAELSVIARRLASTYPEAYGRSGGFSVTALSIRDQMIGRARRWLALLLGATGFVLLLVCANVANLMQARIAGRDRELWLRSALGAGRARLARQLLTESALLALVGGAGGLILAVVTRDLLIAFTATFTLRAAEIAIDRSVFVFAFALSIATGLLFGAVPVATLATPSPRRCVSQHHIGQMLIGAQVAISFVLLIGAGLLVRSFLNLRAVDGGFTADRVLTAVVNLDWVQYDTNDRRRDYFQSLLARVAQQRGVQSAALSLTFPLNPGDRFTVPLVIDEMNGDRRTQEADFRLASPEYFRTIGMTLVSGRVFTARDTIEARHVAIVNLSMARHAFGDASPIGRRMSFDNARTWTRVVGVVNDVKQYGLASESADEVYLPFGQRAPLSATLLVRTAAEPTAMWRDLRRVAYEVDPRQPVSRPLTLEQARSQSIAPPRVTATLASLFAVLALLITGAGIGGVVSFVVTQRTSEIGIRRALGASRWTVVRMVVMQALVPVLAGLGGGVTIALLATRTFASELFEVGPTDPATYAAVAAALAIVAALSCAVPARRAATIEPALALRTS